jgi:hypothetical protein
MMSRRPVEEYLFIAGLPNTVRPVLNFLSSSKLNLHLHLQISSLNHAINFIKKNCTEVTKVEYFTDGCAAQYKNYKTMLILCKHEEGLKASCSLFAPSHSKSPCDGIGGTAKKSVTRYNLQQPAKN